MQLHICRCVDGAEVGFQIFFVLAKWSDKFSLLQSKLKGGKLQNKAGENAEWP